MLIYQMNERSINAASELGTSNNLYGNHNMSIIRKKSNEDIKDTVRIPKFYRSITKERTKSHLMEMWLMTMFQCFSLIPTLTNN